MMNIVETIRLKENGNAYCFLMANLFQECTYIVSANSLHLPADIHLSQGTEVTNVATTEEIMGLLDLDNVGSGDIRT